MIRDRLAVDLLGQWFDGLKSHPGQHTVIGRCHLKFIEIDECDMQTFRRVHDLRNNARGSRDAWNLYAYTPWELERAIIRFVVHYNHHRYHVALGNVTPADMYDGRQREILSRRERIKRETLARRKRENLRRAA